MNRNPFGRGLFVLPMLLIAATVASASGWHHPLFLGRGGYWHARIRVEVTNQTDVALDGRPVALGVGGQPGQLQLVGAEARGIRVCNTQGVEMLFGLTGPDGVEVRSGPIAAGSTLTLPVECPAHGATAYYVYYDNPNAGEVPDFLSAHMRLANGDVEQGEGDTPTAWKHDRADPRHRAIWTDENPQSGKRCLKTVVAEGAEPTWISTRQQGIHITGGAKYRMRAWVKAKDVRGNAGWYIHVGNRKQPMMISPMLHGGGGTYDWKEVTAEFVAPARATRADLGTVLRGTGTAWFDNVRLDCLVPGKVCASAGKPERLELRQLDGGQPWYEEHSPNRATWDHRAVVRVFNFDDRPTGTVLVSVDAAMLDGRLGGRLNADSIRVVRQGKRVPHYLLGDTLLMEVSLPPRCEATYYVYFSDNADIRAAGGLDFVQLVASDRNLVRNPSFENGGNAIADWTHTHVAASTGVGFGPDRPGAPGLGDRCAKTSVPHKAAKGWRGWHQTVSVRPGHTYLLAAQVRTEDVRRGAVLLHAHVRTAAGKLSSDNPMRSAGTPIQGTTAWTRMSGMLAMPADAASLELHLTMDATGTVWHDGVLVAEVFPGHFVRLEGRPMAAPDELAVWPVNAVVKVFRDEPAPRHIGSARIELARNEQEPLQLAIRGGQRLDGVRVEVDPLVGPAGARLDGVEVHVVGYVPIDHATSYYQSQTPEWHRKSPSHPGRCDGWPGPWPDPLLPGASMKLAANQTQAVWITVSASKKTPAGDYHGKVRLVRANRTLAEVPLTVHVWDFALPDETHLKAIYDVRLGSGAKFWGKGIDAAYPELVRFMARRRLCPDTIRPVPTFRLKDGRVSADFAEFDRAAAWYFDQLKLPHSYTPWHFYLFGWGHPPKPCFGERPYPGKYPYEDADRGVLRPEFKKVYQQCLRLFWNHVKEKGWDKKFVLYISDEPHYTEKGIRLQMKALCTMIHEVDPNIPIYSSTWRHIPEWDDSLDIWGIGHYGVVPVEQMEKLKAAGRRIWFTTDGQMCTDTPYCAVERLLPHYCFKYGADAYEFWGVAWLTYDPYRYGWHSYIRQSSTPGKHYWVRYPNGDGFLIYPGALVGQDGPVSSIRLEQAREGVEDFEYLTMLRALADRAKAAGQDTAAAEKALARAAELVAIPNAGGRYSSKILPNPEAVFTVRRAVAEAIQRLKGP